METLSYRNVWARTLRNRKWIALIQFR